MNRAVRMLAVALTAGWARLATAGEDAEVVARAGATEITVAQLRAWLAGVKSEAQAAFSRDPAVLRQVVRSYLTQSLVLQEALQKGWDRRPEVIARLEQARQSTIVENFLEAQTQPPDSYPGEDEVRSAYEQSRSALLVPRQLRLAQIFVALPPGSDPAATRQVQARAEAIHRRLQESGADFAAIARRESEEKLSAAQGGEIGWLTELQIQPELRATIVSLAAGEFSRPIRLEDGWHILKALDIREAYTPTLAAVRPQLVRQLREQWARARRQTYVDALLEAQPVALNELALSKAVPASPGLAPAEPATKPRFK